MHAHRSVKLAHDRLTQITATTPDDWHSSHDPVTGTGDEFFFRNKRDPAWFVYVCVEDGVVTAVETNRN